MASHDHSDYVHGSQDIAEQVSTFNLVMALTKWATGSVSGWLYAGVGQHYASFFGWVLVFSIPPIVLAWLAPFPVDTTRDQDPTPAAGH